MSYANPVLEYRLMRRIVRAIGPEGFWLKKTASHEAEFKTLGRWSRWRDRELVEAHVSLEDLARRCEARMISRAPKLNALKPIPYRIDPTVPVDYSQFKHLFEALKTTSPKPNKPKDPDAQFDLFDAL